MTWKGAADEPGLQPVVFGEQMLVHENSMVKIDDDIPLDRAALVGCGVMTGVGAVFNAAKVEPGATVAVIGCGGVGLSAVNGAALAGAERIIAIDTDAVEAGTGARDSAPPTRSTPATSTRSSRSVISTKGGVHYSFEALGPKRTAEQAFEMLRPGGTATIIGMVPFGMKIELHGFDFLRDRKIQGTSMGGNRFRVDMPRLLSLWRQGRLKLDHLISGRLSLDQINEGFAALKSGGAGAPADRLQRLRLQSAASETGGGFPGGQQPRPDRRRCPAHDDVHRRGAEAERRRQLSGEVDQVVHDRDRHQHRTANANGVSRMTAMPKAWLTWALPSFIVVPRRACVPPFMIAFG